MKVKFWGTRGSIPVPDKKMILFGGNTACLQVSIDEKTIIIDAGTGIIPLGRALLKNNVRNIDIFITHSHWDHIHGFPFFLPAYSSKTKINIFGHTDSFEHFKTILTNQMSYEYFPVRFSDLRAKIAFLDTREVNLPNGRYKMSFIKTNHPAYTIGIKIEEKGKSLVFITDNEIFAPKAVTSRKELVQFCSGATYLVHDAQFTDKEYKKTKGWGHSTYEQVIELAKDAKVKNIVFFHHDPARTDKELFSLEKKYRHYCKGFKVFAAKERQDIVF